jgi:Fanconi anemia group M protein
MIIVDIHEPINIIENLKREGIPIKVKKLTIADYIIGDIAIERKSTNDLYKSIIDKRLFSQLERLKEAYQKAVIILEGEFDTFLYTLQRPETVLGGIVSIAIDYNINIIYSRDKKDTVNILKMIWRRIYKKRDRKIVLRYKPKIMSTEDRLLYIMQGFPGVGEKLARSILRHYGNIRNFATTSLSELITIEGLGEKKAKEIINILTYNYKG